MLLCRRVVLCCSPSEENHLSRRHIVWKKCCVVLCCSPYWEENQLSRRHDIIAEVITVVTCLFCLFCFSNYHIKSISKTLGNLYFVSNTKNRWLPLFHNGCAVCCLLFAVCCCCDAVIWSFGVLLVLTNRGGQELGGRTITCTSRQNIVIIIIIIIIIISIYRGSKGSQSFIVLRSFFVGFLAAHSMQSFPFIILKYK
jgi:hypothetical protein